MGKIMVAVAVLLVISVKAATIKLTKRVISPGGKDPNTASCSPSHDDKPDALTRRLKMHTNMFNPA